MDLLTENTGELIAYEIKSSTTMKREHLKALIKFAEVSKIPLKSIFCIYAGDKSYIGEQGSFIRYMDAFQ